MCFKATLGARGEGNQRLSTPYSLLEKAFNGWSHFASQAVSTQES